MSFFPSALALLVQANLYIPSTMNIWAMCTCLRWHCHKDSRGKYVSVFFLLPIFQYWILYSPNIRNKFSRAHMIDKSANKMIRELAYVVVCCEAHGTWKILLLSLVTVLEMGFVSVYTNGYKSHNRTEKFYFITIYCWCIGNTCWNLTCLFNFVVRVAANVFLLRNQQFSISIYICCPFWVSNSLFKSSTL